MTWSAWLSAQITGFEKLRGCEVLDWRGEEMAILEPTESAGPRWRHPDADALQFSQIQMNTNQGRCLVTTTQAHDDFGLYLPQQEIWPTAIERNARLRPRPDTPLPISGSSIGSMYRFAQVQSLPAGLVETVQVQLSETDEPLIAQVALLIDGHQVTLFAAEFDERLDGSLVRMLMDESVLVQVDGRHPEWTEQ